MGPARRALAQHRSLGAAAHRPWPLPSGSWVIGQSWNELLFAHWPLDADAARRLVPAPLEPDLFDGCAFVGVVPFRMQTVRFAWCPPVVGTSSFAEINVRTYVTHGGRPGIFFLSLDVNNLVALEIGRRAFGLPYLRAGVSLRTAGESVRFRSERVGRRAAFAAEYEPTGPPRAAVPGSLEHWLTERYCFYTLAGGRPARRTEVHHAPWPLQPAAAEVTESSLLEACGIDVSSAPLLHFSRSQDVVAWPPCAC